MKCDILITGTGGQGTVLASRLLAASAMEMGFYTRTSETIGMAQRGGSVTSHVRIDSEENNPIIPFESADLIIGFEPSEVAREIHRLAPNGKCIVNTRPVQPVTASLTGVSYDTQPIIEYIKQIAPDSIFTDGYSLAQKSGSIKTLNVILIGIAAATGMMPFDSNLIKDVIRKSVKPKFVDMNLKAFDIGLEFNKYNL